MAEMRTLQYVSICKALHYKQGQVASRDSVYSSSAFNLAKTIENEHSK